MERTRVLGVLLNDRDWEEILKGTGNEKIDLYLRAAEKHKVNVCFFRLRDINLKNHTVLTSFKQNNSTWKRQRILLPKVIHNRAIYTNPIDSQKLKRINGYGVTIYNSWNGYSKLGIHQLLIKNSSLREFVPLTRLFTARNIKYFLQYPSFFLKPDKGSVGEGIIKLRRLSSNVWKITHQEKNRLLVKRVEKSKIFSLLSNYTNNRKYILQKTIQLQTYNNAPFDIRVSVQKNGEGKWQVTGMVGKVAPKGLYLSNVYQGGKVATLEQLFLKDKESELIKSKLSELALGTIQHLDHYLPNLADVGFDFGIDKNGKPYFIEMNSRDQRYSFLLANMTDTFQATYDNPIGYGLYLLKG